MMKWARHWWHVTPESAFEFHLLVCYSVSRFVHPRFRNPTYCILCRLYPFPHFLFLTIQEPSIGNHERNAQERSAVTKVGVDDPPPALVDHWKHVGRLCCRYRAVWSCERRSVRRTRWERNADEEATTDI